jgi:VWFA-related protein
MPRLAQLLLIVVLAIRALSQSAPNQQPPAVATLRTATKLVVVDVVVTDQQHHPIHNLKRSDFTLREDNVPQTAGAFEEHAPPAGAVKPEPMPTLPPGVFTNISTTPASGPVNILLLDTLNTAVTDQSRVRPQLLDFLKNAKPGTRIAIFGLTTRLTLMQGFTDDPELLKAAISKNPKSSPLLQDPVGTGASQSTISEGFSESAQHNSMSKAINIGGAKAQEFEAENTASQTTSRAKYTLDAMNALARYLVGIPGRKNLIWFSGSFPIDILPDPSVNTEGSTNPFAPFSIVASSADEFRETTNMLARSQVAVYPVSARGVTLLPTTNAAESQSLRIGRSDKQATADANSSNQIFDEHSTMRQMAYQTGGRAFVDTNGLTQAIDDSIADGSSYYTIAYAPTNNNWNGGYRKIEVQLQHHGLDLSYRRGYYADDPDAAPRRTTAPAPATHSNTLSTAMQRGSPNQTQIIFAAHVVPAFEITEKALAPGNREIKTIKGPYRRYTIGIAADASLMTFATVPDGSRHGSIEIVTFVYDADGTLINTMGDTIKTDLTPAVYAKYLHGGIPFKQEISVPAKGTYFLRIAVHDIPSDRIGALEVPIAAVRDLPPATQVPALAPN